MSSSLSTTQHLAKYLYAWTYQSMDMWCLFHQRTCIFCGTQNMKGKHGNRTSSTILISSQILSYAKSLGLQGAGLLMSVELRHLSNRRAQTPAAVDCNSSKKTAALGESRPPILLRNHCCNHLALWLQGHKNIKLRMG